MKGKVSARSVYTFLSFKQTRERMSVRAGEQARRELQGCLWYLTGAIHPLFDTPLPISPRHGPAHRLTTITSLKGLSTSLSLHFITGLLNSKSFPSPVVNPRLLLNSYFQMLSLSSPCGSSPPGERSTHPPPMSQYPGVA